MASRFSAEKAMLTARANREAGKHATTKALGILVKVDAEEYEGEAFGKTVFGRLTCCAEHSEESNAKRTKDTSTKPRAAKVCKVCFVEMPTASNVCC